MPGLINPPEINNPLLRQVEAKIEAAVGKGDARADYLKVVVAGMRAALSGGPNGILAKLDNEADPVKACAIGAVNLVQYLRQVSRGTMPSRAIVPAAATLMLQGLDFADQAGIAKVDKGELDRATHIFANTMFRTFGITMPMLDKLAGAVEGLSKDPGKMAVLQRKMPAQPPETPAEMPEEPEAA